MRLETRLFIGALSFSLWTAPDDAHAAYPERPIKFIVATTAGSVPDVVARLVAERLAASLGQPIVVENRPGAIGALGLNVVAKAAPDGYTLGIMNTTYLAAPSLIASTPYDTEKDFAPVALVAWNYQILVVRSLLPARSVAELIADAKSHPRTLKYSSPGTATPSHLGMKLFELQTGTELVHVSYKGGPAAITALLRGDVDMYLTGLLTMQAHVKSGATRALATMAPQRLAANPELPTMIELGYPELQYSDWQGVVAPRGTPAEVIERLSAGLADVVAKPEMKERFEQLSMEPAAIGPAQFKQLIHSEIQRIDRLVREAHITVD